MEKGDKPKVSTFKKTGGKTAKDKKPAKEKKPAKSTFKKTAKQKQKQKQENVQIVKVNVNTSKEEKPPALAKPVRKEITKQTTYITLDKPYALQPEEEELLTITKHIPNPPRDKSRAKVTTLVSDPKNEIPQPNINPLEEPIPLPQTLKVKPERKPRKIKEPKYDVPVEIFVSPKPKKAKTVEEEQPLIVETSKPNKSQKVKEIIPSTNSSSIDKSIQNSSINNNEKVEELVLAEPTVSEKKTGLKIKPKLKLEEMLIAEPSISEKQTGLKISTKIRMPIEKVEEEVIKERTPIPTKIELKKQELRKIESEMRDISTRNPLYDGLKEQRNNLIDEIDMLREIKKLSTETVPKIIVKQTMDDILTKIENKDLIPAASLEEEIYDYSKNTDDANISNPNSGEKINIQNENELEEEFGLSSAQVLSYKEDYVMTPKGSVQGLIEKIEKKRGAPIKYTTEEERQQASKQQKKESAIRIREQKKREEKLIKQMETDIKYEKFIQGNYPPDSLEEMIQKDIIQPEKAYKETMLNKAYSIASGQDINKLSSNELDAFFDPFVGQDIIVSPKIYLTESESSISRRKEKPDISSDFVSALVDKLSDNNNFGSIQSAQEPQFEFE